MLKFQDFEPIDKNPGIFKPAKFESAQELVDRANDWINEHGIDVINVETLIIPSSMFEGAQRGGVGGGETSTSMYQTLRVWHRQ